MEPKKALLGIVIRADGTVPFDDDVDPDLRAHIIATMFDQGQTISNIKGTPHLKIDGWDHPDGQAKKVFHDAMAANGDQVAVASDDVQVKKP